MTDFVPQKLAYLTAERASRTELAQRLHVLAGENVYTLDRLLRSTKEMAIRDRDTYADYCGEPLPLHVANALAVEIICWERLEDSLATFREAEPTTRDLERYSRNVQQYLAYQVDLLRMQEELVNSCLVKHYETMLDRIWEAANKVDL